MNVRMTRRPTAVAIAFIAAGITPYAAAGKDADVIVSTSKGTVTAVDSNYNIYVNGIRFSTDRADFVVDGRVGVESDIDIGKVVSVYGTLDTDGDSGTAYVVSYTDAVEGPVAAVDAVSGRISVLGQIVIVTADTNLAVGSLDTVQAGQSVEVSGFRAADGRIIATYIGASPAGARANLTGAVTSVDPAAMTITINDLVVDYSQAGIFEIADGTPDVGQQLTIVGTVDAQKGSLVADQVTTSIDGIDAGGVTDPGIDGIDAGGEESSGTDGIDAGGGESSGTDGIDAGGGESTGTDGIDAGGGESSGTDGIDAGGGESSGTDGIDAGGGESSGIDGIDAGGVSAVFEGYVDGYSDLSDTTVSGTGIQIGTETRFVNGSADDLAPNRKVDVRGTLDAGGVFVAETIEFEPVGTEHRTGRIDAVINNEILLDGTAVQLTQKTSFYDESSASLQQFTVADLYAGDAVTMHGYTTADGFVATRLERNDGDVECSTDHDADTGQYDAPPSDD